MDIAATLRSYDGKRVAPFRAVAKAVRRRPEGAIGRLVELAGADEMELQVGATWVLKHLAERGAAPGGAAASRLLRLLDRPLAPDATLHLLQTLPHMDVPCEHAEALRRALVRLIRSRRAFVRAWAYNGLGVLAQQNPAWRGGVEAMFDDAEEGGSPAVRARIRHARAALGRG